MLGSCLLLLPVCGLMIYYSVPAAFNSWKILEQSSDPSGLPRYPLKTMIPIAFLLLGLQGISEAIKQTAILLDVDTEQQEVSR